MEQVEVIITVSGGVVTGIFESKPLENFMIKYTILDFDSMEEEGEDSSNYIEQLNKNYNQAY